MTGRILKPARCIGQCVATLSRIVADAGYKGRNARPFRMISSTNSAGTWRKPISSGPTGA
ncbi:hypothetical protein CUJ84_Chr000204 [Rhizobium leguminosarum]|uniref:Uncharacterized protein n=1 Tax=Rhizobium leguminosarum TaxID=384 RepID=A0A2K9YXB4_RHILE|nr:hypothetical protein CUJ84_Chr000204 [Rhizobium leguminosarum]